MNNDLKIQTLMIYYSHWGEKQNQLRYIDSTMKKIQNVFMDIDDNYKRTLGNQIIKT